MRINVYDGGLCCLTEETDAEAQGKLMHSQMSDLRRSVRNNELVTCLSDFCILIIQDTVGYVYCWLICVLLVDMCTAG